MSAPAIRFADVAFAYPLDSEQAGVDSGTTPEAAVEPAAEAQERPIFSGLTIELPRGFSFVVGPNGIGKSTFMLLAAARLFPQQGDILIGSSSTRDFVDAPLDPDLEERRNQLVSFVYQNMEFETEASIGTLFEMVATNGVNPDAAAKRYEEVLVAADLTDRLEARMQELSKGEMQRAIVVMSMLYQSPIVMMDEPVFAVEPRRTARLFEYLRQWCHDEDLAIYASVHDIELARRYADGAVLFYADGAIESGDAKVLLERDRVERAFKAPWDTLYTRQSLYRDMLNNAAGDAEAPPEPESDAEPDPGSTPDKR